MTILKKMSSFLFGVFMFGKASMLGNNPHLDGEAKACEAVLPRRFNTDANPFEKEYEQNALLQKGFSQQIITDLVQYILRKLPSSRSQPISILDLCCGDGSATLRLLEECEKQSVKVSTLLGIDNSSQQIELANVRSEKQPKLKFILQNVEEMPFEKSFDVVVSLFGLHWMENLNGVATKISHALKPNGLIMFFVPLEKNHFFNQRLQLMSSPKWKETFYHFTVNPFIDTPAPYLKAFSAQFVAENPDGIHCDQPVYFTQNDFIKFLSSWMQEWRFITDKALAENYLKDLVKLIEPSVNPTADVATFEMASDLMVRFLEHCFWYHGVKKEELSEAKKELPLPSNGAPKPY